MTEPDGMQPGIGIASNAECYVNNCGFKYFEFGIGGNGHGQCFISNCIFKYCIAAAIISKNVNFNYHTPLKINGINYDYYVFYVENTAEQAVFLNPASEFNPGTVYRKTDKSEIFYIINETDSQFLTQQLTHNENRLCTLWRQ